MNEKRKILLVDDDANLLAMLGDFLEDEGYEVPRAESGEKALLELRTAAPDLIILDMMMPGIGGMGVLERLALPDGSFRYPVLVLTAKSAMAEYFADKQVDGFLAKPCAPEDLSLEVSRILFQSTGGARPVYGEKPALYLADPSAPRRETLAAALSAAGYGVVPFATAAALVQASVTAPPAVVALALGQSDLPASALVGLLKGMEATAAAKVVVYGIGLPGAKLDDVLALDSRTCLAVPGDGEIDVVSAVASAILGK